MKLLQHDRIIINLHLLTNLCNKYTIAIALYTFVLNLYSLIIKKTCVVGDNRLETRLKILLKFKIDKIFVEPEQYSGFYLDVPPDAARGGKGRGDVTLTG